MQVAETKTSSAANKVIQKKRQPFFNKEGQDSFFPKSSSHENSFFSPKTIQPKLSIGQPNDKYEVEADAMADKVVQRLASPELQEKSDVVVQAKPLAAAITPLVQKKCTTCEREVEKTSIEEEDLNQESPIEIQRKPIFESNADPSDDENNIQRKCEACDKEEEGKLQTKAEGSGGKRTTTSLESQMKSTKGAGSALPEVTRVQMEDSFGTDFSGVRVHTGGSAMQMNKELRAQAFTNGHDIYFNAGKYDPETSSGKHLLAHELTHTIQQGENKPIIQRSPASEMIDSHTSWGDLDEIALGRDLKNRMIRGNYAFVNSVLDELGWFNLDDIAFEIVRQSQDTELHMVAGDETGRRLLDRMYDLMTAGNFSQEEQTQSDRILDAKVGQMDIDQFPEDISGIKVFPFRLPGLTVLSDAPILAERRANGRIHVEMPVRVLGTSTYDQETRTLPTETFISGIEILENEIIGIKLYDLGGPVVFKPALYLIRLSNETTTQVITTMIEAAGIGITLGAGQFVVLGAEASMAARAVLWADRAAFVLGTLTTMINEHRGWIISSFGESGRDFVRYNSLINAAVAIYGIGRMVYGLGQLLSNFRSAYSNWRGVSNATENLDEDALSIVSQIQSQTDEFLENADNISTTRRPDAPELDVETPVFREAEDLGRTSGVDSETPTNIDNAGPGSALDSADRVGGRIVTQVEEGVQIGGRRHGLSIKVTEDGRTIVQICTDCDGILHVVSEAMRDPEIASDPDLMDSLRRIQEDAFDVQTALPEGRMTNDAADSILDDLAEQLEQMANGPDHPLTPHLDSPSPVTLPRLTEQEALDIINGVDDMSPVQIDELLTRHTDDPVLWSLLRRRGTLIDSHFRSQIVSQLRQNLPSDTLFTPTDSTDLRRVLGLDELPWTGGNGPDLILVDSSRGRIAVLDLTSRPNTTHLRSKEAQAEALMSLLGREWSLDGVKDFYHSYRNMTLESTLDQIGDILLRFRWNG